MLGEGDQDGIIYRSDAVHPGEQANFRVFASRDFLAEVSAHLPDAHEKATRFSAWYSNRTPGYRNPHGLLGEAEVETPTGEARAPPEVCRSWARLIRQVYEADSLLCPHCGGTMKILAVIEHTATIRQILDHGALPALAPSLRAPPDPARGAGGRPAAPGVGLSRLGPRLPQGGGNTA
jgi:hypothetical protein